MLILIFINLVWCLVLWFGNIWIGIIYLWVWILGMLGIDLEIQEDFKEKINEHSSRNR